MINAATRQPVREFELEFHPAQQIRAPAESPLHSFKTKDGRFECRGLPAGIWTIFATARGYQRFELHGVEISNGKTAEEVLIPMRPGHALQGRVFDESSDDGIAGATINFREAHVSRYEGNFRSRLSTISQKDGAFILDGLPAGPVIVGVYAQNYAARELDITIGDRMVPVEIALSAGGTISGYLAGTDGLTPVAGTISLMNLDESSGSTSRTGSAGEFNFPRLSPARYRLTGHGGGMSGAREITITHNEQMEGIVLAMRGGHDIRGVISGLKPEEFRSVSVSIGRQDEQTPPPETAVDERGAFTISGVTPGKLMLSAHLAGRRQVSKTVAMPADTDLTVNLDFPHGSRLTGRVTYGGKPLGGVMLIPDARNSRKQDLLVYDARTSATGEYAIEDLPDGEYTIWVGSYGSPTVRVAGDTVFDIDVPSAQLSGRLFEDGGKVPVVGATVAVWSAQPGATATWLSARSDHFGQFAIGGLQPGDFVISAYKPGYELYRAPLAYGSPISGMAISLRPARGAEVRIRDATSGEPVHNVTTIEMINGQRGMFLQMNLDQNGVGYLPSAMAGSSLRFGAMGYGTATITDWNGQALEVTLQRQQPAN
jgi:hypothetical protein